MITLVEIQNARKKIALPGWDPWEYHEGYETKQVPMSWQEYDRSQTSFATLLFGLAPNLFKLYRNMGEDLIAFEVDKSGVSVATERPNALHELAHWVEMRDSNRWLLPNWGIPSKSLAHRQEALYGIRPLRFKTTAPGTVAALSREVRVLAIEAHMRLYIPNRDLEPNRMREGVAKWGDEYFLGELIQLPFGKFKERQDIRDWVSTIWQTTFDAWNLDRIEHEFKKRIEMVREFMETKEC